MTRIGILGLGSIGLRHAALAIEGGLEVVGYDPDAHAAGQLEVLGGRFQTREDVLAGSDAIVIASSNECHLVDLADAVTAGRATLVEKPMAHDLAEVEAVLERADAAGVPVLAAYNLRHREVVQVARRWLRDGDIGDPVLATFVYGSYLPDWRPGSDYRTGYAADPETGGVIFDVIHELDLALHLLGEASFAGAVADRSGRLEMTSEDRAVIVLGHRSNCLTTLHLDYLRRPARRSLEIVGTEGVLSADLRSGRASAVDRAGDTIRQYDAPIDRNAEYRRQLEKFVTLDLDDPCICHGRDALASLELAIAARGRALPVEARR